MDENLVDVLVATKEYKSVGNLDAKKELLWAVKMDRQKVAEWVFFEAALKVDELDISTVGHLVFLLADEKVWSSVSLLVALLALGMVVE